jgi:hypothetical protein
MPYGSGIACGLLVGTAGGGCEYISVGDAVIGGWGYISVGVVVIGCGCAYISVGGAVIGCT